MITVYMCHSDAAKMLILTVKGHAGQNTCGHDLVCAAASILTFTVCEAVRNMEKRKRLLEPSSYTMKPGNAEILCKCKTKKEYEKMKTVFETANIGYLLLQEQYPAFLQMKEMNGQPSVAFS